MADIAKESSHDPETPQLNFQQNCWTMPTVRVS